MIGLVDYGMGNLLSVYNALEMIGTEVEICNNPIELLNKDKIILPGVGSFGDCMSNLKDKGFYEVLDRLVTKEKYPILGICLGMQVMADKSFEVGEHKGFGWIKGDVLPIKRLNLQLKIPHVGWNALDKNHDDDLLKGLPDGSDVYFTHSYYMKCNNDDDVIANCQYGVPLTAAIHSENIFGTQFHPEKSQDYGLRILENFVNWKN
ncbi:MAG: imidazole glycerol phosphate synthase subunit HisH [Gammaproteobacteria bacterium]|nr:imidazole glycerol phosphate synthase subunit HisH [Gammaproteobacteria bacterium]